MKKLLRSWTAEDQAVFFLSFLLVFPKKWEPGGNIDTVWYAAIAKNIAETGNYFHFFISKYYLNNIHDHLPLTYWVTATVFRVFGVSDFTSRLYPLFCSMASYLLVYAIGKKIKGAAYGLAAVVMYALCLGSTKWNGSLLHDVPLTTYFLGATYCLLATQKKSVWLIGVAVWVSLGILTKGPIIGGFVFGALLWIAWEKNFRCLLNRSMLAATLIGAAILSILFWPPFLFDGTNYYTLFYREKLAYATQFSPDFLSYFSFVRLLVSLATVPLLLIAVLAIQTWRKKIDWVTEPRAASGARLFVCVTVATLVPLSFFRTKFPHYILPVYPYLALLSAFAVVPVFRRKNAATMIKHGAIAVSLGLLALPIKVTGKRSKDLLNLVNFIHLDSEIKTKEVYFRGDYWTDMGIYQHFKFYGDIDLRYADPNVIDQVDLRRAYLVAKVSHLPFKWRGTAVTLQDCLFVNSEFCAVTETKPQFRLPDFLFPHEVY
jgi:4-amino-4-deoxy-L-arabinose transferase-like glycosyltransferase